mmetsp:Transcript_46312/g.106168  ORF Transcript_46312/g.106168 Transcript_46312/m.106168 type:complete len:501 (-) Transcript_46312:305-1807(-)
MLWVLMQRDDAEVVRRSELDHVAHEHLWVVLGDERAEGVPQLLEQLCIALEQRLVEDDIIVAEERLVYLREVVREVALQRELAAHLAAHVEEEDVPLVSEQHIGEDRVAVDDMCVLKPLLRLVLGEVRLEHAEQVVAALGERQVERAVRLEPLAHLRQIVRPHVQLIEGEHRARRAGGRVHLAQRREKHFQPTWREAAIGDEVRESDPFDALQRERRDAVGDGRAGGGEVAAAVRGDGALERLAHRREEAGDVGGHVVVEEDLAAEHRPRGSLDHIVALQLHVVEVARRHHPRLELRRGVDAPAEVLRSVHARGAGYGRVDVDMSERLAEVNLVVRDLELLEHPQRLMAARGNNHAHVPSRLSHQPRSADDNMVPRLLELTHQLHILLDRHAGGVVVRFGGLCDQHVVQREAEAALDHQRRHLPTRYMLYEGLQLGRGAAVGVLVGHERIEDVPAAEQLVDDIGDEVLHRNALWRVEHRGDRLAEELAGGKAIRAYVRHV